MKLLDVLCFCSVIINDQPLWEHCRFLQKGGNEYFGFSDIIYMLFSQVNFLNHHFLSLVAFLFIPLSLYACRHTCTPFILQSTGRTLCF